MPPDALDFLKAEPGTKVEISSEVPNKDGEGEQQPPKDKKDQAPPPKKDPPPQKKEKEDQIRDLANTKKKLEDDLKAAQERLSKFEKATPLLKIGDKLKEKYGEDITDDIVTSYINEQESREKELEDIRTKYKEKDEKLSEINITLSDEWNQDYAIPLTNSVNNLMAVIAEVDSEGKIKHEQLFNELKMRLLEVNPQTGAPLDSVKIKGIMRQFAQEYEDKTKEEYDVPRLNDVVNSVISVAKLSKDAIDARRNWATKLQEKQKQKAFDEQEKTKAFTQKEIAGRNHAFNKVVTNFNTKEYEGIFTEDEIKEKLSVPHTEIMKVMKGEGEAYGYDNLIERLGRAELVPGLVAKVRALEKELADELKRSGSGLPMNGGRKPSSQRPQTEADRINNDPDPIGFLKT